MSRSEDWRAEVRDATQKERWALFGPNRVVKVSPNHLPGSSIPPREKVGGYITLAKFINGMSPVEIERNLGLPPRFLWQGAIIYNLLRLPNPSEYTYELTARFPEGLSHNPAHFDPRYGPGSDKIHQWKILPGISIPVDTAKAVYVRPQERFRA